MRFAGHGAWLLVGVLLLTACDSHTTEPSSTSSSTPSSTPTPTPAPAAAPPPAPSVGACYRLSYDEAVAPTSEDPPVSCGSPHTAETFAVGKLDLVSNGHLLAVDSGAAQKQVSQRCPAQLAAYVGATSEQLRLSMLRPVWFLPTSDQSAAGADWYRCDVIAVTGSRQVAKVDHALKGALKKPAGRAELAMCATAQPGSSAFSRVPCREDHSWKAISVIDLADESKHGGYPGEDAVKKAGQEVCQADARAIASDALDYQWGYEWPTKDQWQAGQTYGRCWSPDPA